LRDFFGSAYQECLDTHFVGVNGAFGRTVLIVNNVDTFEAFRVQPFFGANLNPSSIVLGQKFSATGADVHPYDGLIDNIRVFSVFASPNLVSEMYERSFSVYPPANMIMSLTFDDDVGRDEVSGRIISIQKLPFSTLKGQWFSICSHLRPLAVYFLLNVVQSESLFNAVFGLLSFFFDQVFCVEFFAMECI